MRFYRLLQQSVDTDPHPLTELSRTSKAIVLNDNSDDFFASDTYGEF